MAVAWTERGTKHADPESPHLATTAWQPTSGFAKSFEPPSNVVAMTLWFEHPTADVGRAHA
ncbi:MAG: hypothetical protein RAK21_03795, partial [Synechococcus sp. SP2 MAG]|nr:hypothetical protein [Synechococcus sp. SP2 MAG]